MTEYEAMTLIAMVEDGWGFKLEAGGRTLWLEALLPYNAEHATRAVAELSKREHFRPTPADVITLVETWTERDRQERERQRVVGSRQPDCRTCLDQGWLVVYERPVEQTAWMQERGIEPVEGASIEEMGPCPDCPTGKANELAAYGEEGFWRGRDRLMAEARHRANPRPALTP